MGGEQWQGDITRDITHSDSPTVQIDEFWLLNENNTNTELEFGIDWVGNDNDWKWHILGLAVNKKQNYENAFHQNYLSQDNNSDSKFKQEIDIKQSIYLEIPMEKLAIVSLNLNMALR